MTYKITSKFYEVTTGGNMVGIDREDFVKLV